MNPPAVDTLAIRKSIRTTKTIFWESVLYCLFSPQLYYINFNAAKPSVFGDTATLFGIFIASFVPALINSGNMALGWMDYWTQFTGSVIIIASAAMQAIPRRIQPGGR
jgi:hypothetical protein